MGFSIETSISILTVFFQGLLSFFSPCVLPLIPVYIGYLTGGSKIEEPNDKLHAPRTRILIHTLFFVLGISFAFFLLGFGVSALSLFLNRYRVQFSYISGIIMILFGLYQLNIFGRSHLIEREHRLSLRIDRFVMGPITALILGFCFSFAWTPCIGPVLSSVLLMTASSSSAGHSFLLIGVYTLGFSLPFLLVGFFTGTVLAFFKKHQGVVQHTVKIGALLLIVMGCITIFGFSKELNTDIPNSENQSKTQQDDFPNDTQDTTNEEVQTQIIPAPDFTLKDQYGEEHKLSDYKGKTVFLNFWATWCPPCRDELPEIQSLYEEHGENTGDIIILGIAAPNQGGEGSIEEITAFLSEKNLSFPVVMNESGDIFSQYGISAFPTTFMIDQTGAVFGYVEGAMTKKTMDSIIEQTLSATNPKED